MKALSPRTLLLPSPSAMFRSVLLFHSKNEDAWKRKSRQWDEENRRAKVFVWWDFENCSVPVGVNVFKVSDRIIAALRASGIEGPVRITAYGDISQLSRSTQEALVASGINVYHVPRSGKNSADRSLLADLVFWVSQNPPPANLFLISGDGDFSNVMNRLKMKKYNILLASNECNSPELCSTASVMWHWSELVRGRCLSGKHFNHPPNSWFGQYKEPVDDPLSDSENPTFSLPEDPLEPEIDLKPRQIPKAIVNRIRQTVSLYPQGIGLGELRSELQRNNVTIDKDFYGHKKFSHFLLSMPNVLKIQRHPSEGRLFAYGINPKPGESFKSDLRSPTMVVATKEDVDQAVNEESNVEPSAPDPQPRSEHQPICNEEIDRDTNMGCSTAMEDCDSVIEEGFFRRLWRNWLGDRISSEKSASIPGKPGTKNSKEAITSNEKNLGDSKNYNGESSERSGLFSRILKGSKFWNTGEEVPVLDPQSVNENKNTQYTDKSGEDRVDMNQMIRCSVNHDLFSKTSFWNDMESFFRSPKGSTLICKSRTREQLIKKLQNEGPLILSTLREGHLLRLADILISKKKWVEESPSQIFPFKIALPSKPSCASPSNNHGSNGLSSIFSGGMSRVNVGRLAEPKLDKRDPDSRLELSYVNGKDGPKQPEDLDMCSTDGDSSGGKNKKPSKMSKNEIIGDCQKLLDEILEKNPKGYNLGAFKPLFYERHGYVLDHKTLGYPKLASLLQLIPGVKVDTTRILPAESSQGKEVGDPNISRSEITIDTVAGQDSDWEELGPILEMGVPETSTDLGASNETRQETERRVNFDEGSSLPDVDFSDSDSEIPYANGSKEPMENRRHEDDSSLLKILDSWYSSKDQSQSPDGFVDCSSTNGSEPAESCTVSADSPFVTMNHGRKLKFRKNYSFVSEPVNDEKEKLIDSILGSLKKSRDSRMGSHGSQ